MNRTARIGPGWPLAAAAVLAAGVAAWATWGFRAPGPEDAAVPAAADPFPAPPISASPFLNTRPEARFVGSEACRACHAKAFESFGRTGMGRSMAEVEPDREPPDGSFDHALSGRRYQVVRKDGRLWHRELLLASGADEVVLEEHPLRWVVGSGHHSLTYLAEADGFLVESPVTWYTGRRRWDVSPGYDRRDQVGFERPVGEGCLICHAGRAEALDGSLHRTRVVEPVIGCERCHGPGSLHVERWAAGRPAGRADEAVDHTIVNPAHLSRELADAVCEQCHLTSELRLTVRGRSPADFRPGLPLQDFWADYELQAADAPMKVVGHVDQLHKSRCYRESKTLSCATCHDPHGFPKPEERVAYYRQACLACHAANACRADPARRRAESPDNDCVHCHMPSSSTEIPHLAFTHHRIGLHPGPVATASEAGSPRRPGVLQPFHDLSRLGDLDRRRLLGMAYAETAAGQQQPDLAGAYGDRAGELLWPLAGLGLRDPTLECVLYQLSARRSPGQAVQHLEKALAEADLAINSRCDGMNVLARVKAAEGRPDEAVGLLRQLVRLRRNHADWLLLAECERARGNQAAAVDALETAARIHPVLPAVHSELVDVYARQGNQERADWHRRRAAAGAP